MPWDEHYLGASPGFHGIALGMDWGDEGHKWFLRLSDMDAETWKIILDSWWASCEIQVNTLDSYEG